MSNSGKCSEINFAGRPPDNLFLPMSIVRRDEGSSEKGEFIVGTTVSDFLSVLLSFFEEEEEEDGGVYDAISLR